MATAPAAAPPAAAVATAAAAVVQPATTAADAKAPAVPTTRTTVFTHTMGDGQQIRISEVWGVNEVGTKLWDTQLLLAKHFEAHNPPLRTFGVAQAAASVSSSVAAPVRHSRWCELGAGCGLLALILQRLGCEVVATEIPEILPLLQTNIDANKLSEADAKAQCAAGPPVRAAKLFWGLESDIATFTRAGGGAPFDGVVASDVTYIDELIVPLLETIHALSSPQTYIAIAGRIRSESAHLMFVTHAQAIGFDVDITPLNAPPAPAAAPATTATAATAATATPPAKPASATASLPVESADDHFDTASTFDFLCRLTKRK